MASRVPPDEQMIWIDSSEQSVRTIFTPNQWLFALDPKLPAVKEGLRITKKVLVSLKNDSDSEGIRLLIVLIPTKERAYCGYLKDSGDETPNALVRLCDSEEEVKTDLKQFMENHKISYIDVTGALEEKVYQHVQVYSKGSDGHPRASGYHAIAQTVYEAVRDQREKTSPTLSGSHPWAN